MKNGQHIVATLFSWRVLSILCEKKCSPNIYKYLSDIWRRFCSTIWGGTICNFLILHWYRQ